MSPTRRPDGVRAVTPEPQSLWIRYAPRRWPTPGAPWTDLSRRRLGAWTEDRSVLERMRGWIPDDVVYLPPTPPSLRSTVEDLAEELAGRGAPVVCQVQPDGWRPRREGVVAVVDLLPLVLQQVPWEDLKAGEVAVWPLIPGGPGPESWSAPLERLADLGFSAVQPLVLEHDPSDLRVLGELLPEDQGLDLFHSKAATPAAFSGAVLAAGLQPYVERPLPRPPLVRLGNLEAAGRLALAGEVSHLLGLTSRAGDLLRAARFAEGLKQDLQSVVREGHVGLLPWASKEVIQVLEEWGRGGSFGYLEGLYAELSAKGPATPDQTN